MHKLLLIGFITAGICGCDDMDAGKPDVPEVTRPIEIDRDKPTLGDRVPPPPNNADTATSPDQNVPTTNPATRPAPSI